MVKPSNAKFVAKNGETQDNADMERNKHLATQNANIHYWDIYSR